MKIYTKTGDKGETSLLSGSRVSKSDIRIEAYGTVDELNSNLGLIRDQVTDGTLEEFITSIQAYLFTIGSHLADDGKREFNLPELTEDSIKLLEDAIDMMNESVPPMTNFILPGGHTLISQAHVSRTICRRAERRVVDLTRLGGDYDLIVRYLNRLSDYLFVLARYLHIQLGVDEIPWKPKKG